MRLTFFRDYSNTNVEGGLQGSQATEGHLGGCCNGIREGWNGLEVMVVVKGHFSRNKDMPRG